MQGKRELAGVIYCCKMTSFMALDGVMSFYAWKTLQIHVSRCNTVQLLAGIIKCNGRKLEETEDFKWVFVLYCVLEMNRSALVCELLSNNLRFVSQLFEDKSLALRACDLIFFTTDLQTVNY